MDKFIIRIIPSVRYYTVQSGEHYCRSETGESLHYKETVRLCSCSAPSPGPQPAGWRVQPGSATTTGLTVYWSKPQPEKLSTNLTDLRHVMWVSTFLQSRGSTLPGSIAVEGRVNQRWYFVFVNNKVDIGWQDDTRRMSDDHLTQRHNVSILM